jgi:hypothetical protein
MRSDSILVTGMDSHSINKAERVLEAKNARKEKKERVRTVIAPTIEPVLEEIDKERQKTILGLIEVVETGTSQEDIKATILALNLYKESLDSLKSRLQNIMRVSK